MLDGAARANQAGIPVLGLVVIVIVVGLPLAYMLWRFKRGAEAVPGGSYGEQLGRGDDDRGPTSST